MIDSFDRSEFLGFFCEDGRVFLEQLQRGLETLAGGYQPAAFEECARAAHSLTGAARMMSLPALGALFADTEQLLAGLEAAELRNDGSTFGDLLGMTGLLAEGLQEVCSRRAEDAETSLVERWRECVARRFPWLASPAAGFAAVDPAASEPDGVSAAAADVEVSSGWPLGLTLDLLRRELAVADPELRELFREEIATARADLLSISADLARPEQAESVVGEARRWIHLFAGSAAMVGLDETAARLRALDGELDEPAENQAVDGERVERARRSLSVLLLAVEDVLGNEPLVPPDEAPVTVGAVDEETLRDFEAEARDLLDRLEAVLLEMDAGGDPRALAQEALRAAHTLKGIAFTVGREALGRGAHRYEEELARLGDDPAGAKSFVAPALLAVDRLREAAAGARPVDALLADLERALAGDESVRAAPMAGEPTAEGEILRVSTRRLDQLMDLVGELVISRNRMATQLDRLAELRRALRVSQERLVGMVESFRRRYEFQESAVGVAGGMSLDLGFSGLELDRYDDLNVLSRSLIEISADTSEVMREVQSLFGGFGAETESLQRITSTLQSDISSIRMVPVSRLFQRLVRPLRDAARSEGREVRIEVSGGESEIDRSLLDGLYGALVHVVRNAVAHGLEAPAERREQGKAPAGLVRFQARQEGGRILFEVSDDGRGVDWDRVRAAAERLGVETTGVDPEQVLFLPGISTRSAAGDLAGRGVGLTAVREAVERVGGRVQLRSRQGLGTTVVLDVPTSLAIHQALIVEAAGETYAMPLTVVDEVAVIRASEVQETSAGAVVLLRGEPVPCRDLAVLVGAPASDGVREVEERPAVVVQVGGRRQVLMVERIAARQEVVLKALGPYLERHEFVQGASFAGDGAVVLVLDAARLLGASESGSANRRATARTESGSEGTRRCRVLVVDDSLSVRRAAQRLLADLDAEVHLARDGVEALEAMRTLGVDLILTDLEMPRLNGFELIASLRRNAEHAQLPIVVISSRGSEKHRRHAESLGATGYVTKPFSREDLAEWVRLSRNEGSQA